MKATITLAAVLLMSSAAQADSWLYAGGQIGQATRDGESSLTQSVHFGTGILPIIGLEAGYYNHGKFEYSNEKISANSLYFGLKPSIDFGPIHLYAKAGVHAWNEDSNRIGEDDDGTDLMYGVGAEYFIFGPVSLGASFQQFKMGNDDINSVTLSGTFHFL